MHSFRPKNTLCSPNKFEMWLSNTFETCEKCVYLRVSWLEIVLINVGSTPGENPTALCNVPRLCWKWRMLVLHRFWYQEIFKIPLEWLASSDYTLNFASTLKTGPSAPLWSFGDFAWLENRNSLFKANNAGKYKRLMYGLWDYLVFCESSWCFLWRRQSVLAHWQIRERHIDILCTVRNWPSRRQLRN